VAASGVDVARQVLLQSDLGAKVADQRRPVAPARLALALAAGLVVLVVIVVVFV
jgi:hypothetical protein